MNIIFLSRKRRTDTGGLARFATELISRFPPADWRRPIENIHATDATLAPLGVILKLFLRAPLTVTAHGRDIIWPNRIYQNVFTLCMPYVDAWVVDSAAAAALLKPKGTKKICVIPPGISIRHFKKPSSFVSQHTDKIILATVGNLVSRKGHEWFIRHVFRKLPARFVYLIVGDGKERKRISSAIEKYALDKRVFLLGRLPDARLAQVLTHTDLYVAPNRHVSGDFEGFGIAAGEAAAMGLPVVASRVDGLPSVIHHNKNGHLVLPTAKAWLTSLTTARKIPSTAHYTRTHFSWKNTATQYARLFREVAGKTKASPKPFSPT